MYLIFKLNIKQREDALNFQFTNWFCDSAIVRLCNCKTLQLEALYYHVQFVKVSLPLCQMSDTRTNADASISLELRFLREINPVVHAIT